MQYRCQSAWKLVELDDTFHFFRRSACRTVLDLAAAPGGFAQVALERLTAASASAPSATAAAAAGPSPAVIAVDLRPIEPLPGIYPIQCNLLHHEQVLRRTADVLQRLPLQQQSTAASHTSKPTLSSRGIDIVLHDGVSVVSGQHAFSVTYAQSQMTLSALLLACRVFSSLGPGSSSSFSFLPQHSDRQRSPALGPSSSSSSLKPDEPRRHSRDSRAPPVPVWFVSKVMQCRHTDHVLHAARHFFSRVEVHKPAASKATSRETYLVAFNFRSNRFTTYLQSNQRSHACGAWRREANVFSLPPAADDVSVGEHMVWCCLGCGQTRFGTSPCPACCGVHARQR